MCAKGIPTQGGQNRWGVSTTARAWEDQAGGAQSPSSLPFSLMCSFFPRWAASARPWLLPPATCGFCMASTCHGAHTSPNQTARSFFSRSPQNIDFSSNTPSAWAVRARRSPLNQADVPGSEVTWYRHGCLGPSLRAERAVGVKSTFTWKEGERGGSGWHLWERCQKHCIGVKALISRHRSAVNHL